MGTPKPGHIENDLKLDTPGTPKHSDICDNDSRYSKAFIGFYRVHFSFRLPR